MPATVAPGDSIHSAGFPEHLHACAHVRSHTHKQFLKKKIMLNTLLLYLNYFPAMVNPNSLPKILWLNRVKTASFMIEFNLWLNYWSFYMVCFFIFLLQVLQDSNHTDFFYVFGSCRFACSFCLLVCLFLKIWSFSILRLANFGFLKKYSVFSPWFSIYSWILKPSPFLMSVTPLDTALFTLIYSDRGDNFLQT